MFVVSSLNFFQIENKDNLKLSDNLFKLGCYCKLFKNTSQPQSSEKQVDALTDKSDTLPWSCTYATYNLCRMGGSEVD